VDTQELQRIAKTAGRHPLWTPDGLAIKVSFGRDTIERLIPHRDPFLLVDEITEVGLSERTIRGRRRVDAGDPVFRGHFPGQPVYPGVLQLEIIGQLALCLLYFLSAGSIAVPADAPPRNVRAVKIHLAQFLSPVGPGDELSVICRAVHLDEFTGVCSGQILRGATICSFGVSEIYFPDE
jgi:3-hydroxyacyl-[acyl-carrier-protein] dehydratase